MTTNDGGTVSRAGAESAVLLLADLQSGIADLPLTVSQAELKRSVESLIRLARLFEIPIFVTAVPGGDGSVPTLIDAVRSNIRDETIYVRTTPDSLADPIIASALRDAGRRTLIIAGVATEVAVQLPALSGASQGFDVHVVIDACGGVSPRTEDAALRRMAAAGVQISSVSTLVGELAGDFSQPRGAQAIEILFGLAAS